MLEWGERGHGCERGGREWDVKGKREGCKSGGRESGV